MTGFLIGSAARFALPGPDPMPFWLTVLIGLMGSATGTAISALILGRKHTFDNSSHAFVTLLLAVGFATALVAAYRILIQKRPIFGPDAHRFPRRGLGIARMRRHLDQLGIDPDKLGRGVRAAEAAGPALAGRRRRQARAPPRAARRRQADRGGVRGGARPAAPLLTPPGRQPVDAPPLASHTRAVDRIGDILERPEALEPRADAIRAPGRLPLTHGELGELVSGVAGGLRASGFVRRRPGSPSLVGNGPEAACAFLALTQAAAVAPLNPAYRAQELAFYLEDIRADAVVVDARLDTPVREVARSSASAFSS